MHKSDLITNVQNSLNFANTEYTKKEATRVVDTVLEQIQNQLAMNEDVSLHQFGTFKVKDSPARKARNPQTGGTVDVPARKKVKFKPAPALNRMINPE